MENKKKINLGFCYIEDKVNIKTNFRPLGFCYIKSSIEKYLPNKFKYTYFINDSKNKFDIVLISSLSPNWSDALKVIKKLRQKNPDIKIIIGGQHITQFPQLLPDEADFGLRGESEISAPQLLRLIIENEKDKNLYKKIDGIVFKENDNFFISEPRRLSFDEISYPDRLFQGGNKKNPYLLTSRGCPFCCNFCSSSKFWNKVSFQSAESIAEEIEFISEKFPHIDNLPVWDDLFVFDKKRLNRLYEILKEKNLIGRFSFNCAIRADLVDDELCDILKKLNFKSCFIGFEHTDNRLLKLLKPGGDCTIENNLKAIKKLNEYGLKVNIAVIFGSPTETEKDVIKAYDLTLDLLEKKAIEGIYYHILMPMPGTYFWQEALKMGLVEEKNDFDWNKLSVFVDYKNTKFKNFRSWLKERKKRGSIYLNEEHLPESRLIEIMEEYDKKRSVILRKNTNFREKLANFVNKKVLKIRSILANNG